ncbi:hypothetical protein NL329_31005, partial [Klebsiella pneumoniae]|nr:hypothetical protein [Klebsiella pneumoniae]
RYLSSDETLGAQWDVQLGPRTKPRIGAVWSGSRAHKNDANRSVPFGQFSDLLSDAAQWVCLQNELRAEEAEAVLGAPG